MIESEVSVKCSLRNILNNGIKVEWTGIISPTIKSPRTSWLPFHRIRVMANVTKLASSTVNATDMTVIHTLLKKYRPILPLVHTFI
ncbi:hypothetical protein D3C73_1379730 [compost metagenome]